MRLINRQHFLNVLLRYNKLHPIYNTLKYGFNQKVFVNGNEFNKYEYEKSLFYFNYCFPRYLKPELGDYKKLSFKLPPFVYKSYGIIIDEKFESAEDYLKSHFSSNQRYTIRRRKTLLEKCFNISTKVYYGIIDFSEYEHIMNKAKELLGGRFEQKNIENEYLVEWTMYQKCLFPLINKKKASIFVVYNETTPIQININFNINKTCFATMLIYDIDYSKFGMGHIGAYNVLDWCIKNKYDFLDLGMSTYDYKTKWSNFNYDLETQIIFNKEQKVLNVLGYMFKILFMIKYIFISLKFWRRFRNEKRAKKNAPILEDVKIEKVTDLPPLSLNILSLNEVSNYPNLRKTINDFLYAKKVHENSVKLYKNEESTFFIKSKNEVFKFNL